MSDTFNSGRHESKPDPLPWEFDGGIPEGDNPDVTRHLAESTVAKLVAVLHEIVDMNEVHSEMAPRTATKVSTLLIVLADEVLAWVRRWQA
ncbi:hypothetical protein IU470_28035 [Nocardia abscessus]|uniref:Uncharacterized protein n=1 Tax=Nocardia abscessus TaxID=120957 RepID=A0ABS0CKH6_9NOCA|nr:hypothetical protein [Nocardia abscessus]MBF6228928.1 hypothetical protein [Nocardia abscessus]